MNLNEKGFSLLEMIVAISVGAIIALGASMTTVQMINVTARNNHQTTAIRQAQNVGFWMSQDLLMGHSANVSDDPGTPDTEFVTITWKHWETGDYYDIRYVWTDSIESLKKLKRNQITRDKNGLIIETKSMLIADNILSANLSLQNGVWDLSVGTRSGKISEFREFEINKRTQTSG